MPSPPCFERYRIIALSVIGTSNFEEDARDEWPVQKLINLFVYNKRYNIVEFLAKETELEKTMSEKIKEMTKG